MSAPIRLATAALALLVALPASAAQLRNDTTTQANAKIPFNDPAVTWRKASNWPGLPERQSGKAYRQMIFTTSGFRERNFESGRR